MARQLLPHAAEAQHARRIAAPPALAAPAAQRQLRHLRMACGAAAAPGRRRRLPRSSALPENEQQQRTQQPQRPQQQPQRPQQQPQRQAAGTLPPWAESLRRRWEELDTPQRGYVVLVGALLLASAPRLVTLVVIGAERVVIGGLLAAEEVLLELVLKGGALLGLAALLALAAAGVWLFVGRGRTTR